MFDLEVVKLTVGTHGNSNIWLVGTDSTNGYLCLDEREESNEGKHTAFFISNRLRQICGTLKGVKR